jgi:metallo-beta-lactamase family protein
MKLKFIGAARTVTGSKHLLETWDHKKILIDCGLYQGLGKETFKRNAADEVEATTINAVILTHAHMDHAGLLPRLVKQGYEGPIYCTPATQALLEIMLPDSAFIQESDVRFAKKYNEKAGHYEPLYTLQHAKETLQMLVPVEEYEEFNVLGDIKASFHPNGHILGSAAVFLRIAEPKNEIKILFTGDIGRYDTALICNPVPPPEADYVICESTYGDRLHDTSQHAEQLLLDIIMETVSARKGKLIIPAFSLGRTQEIVFALNKLDLYGLLPRIKVYVDSPLAVNATDIMRQFKSQLNKEVQRFVDSREDPFGFSKLKYIKKKEESQALNESNEPCVIISASGMADAGRVKHHIFHTIEDEKNTILFVGYAEPNSLGGRLQRGEDQVTIFGESKKVRSEIDVITSLSAHGDYKEMIQYLDSQNKGTVKNVFLVHGEESAQNAFKEHLKNAGFGQVTIPYSGETFELS